MSTVSSASLFGCSEERKNPTSRENIRRGLTIVLRSVDKNKASRSRSRAKINDVWTWNMATGYETFTGV